MHVFVAVNNAKNFLRLAAAQFSAEASVSGHGQKSPKISGLFQIKPHVPAYGSISMWYTPITGCFVSFSVVVRYIPRWY